MAKKPPLWTALLLLPLIALTWSGCDPDERVEKMAKQSLDRQAEQNQTIAAQTQAITTTTACLLDAETQARQDLVALQQQLAEADAQARLELMEIQDAVVQRDADCRRELNEIQKQTQIVIAAERQSIDRHRSDLEAERQQIAQERHRAPIVAAAITQVGLVLGCLAPLLLAGYLLYVVHHSRDNDAAVTELLIQEIVAEEPRFLPRSERPALPDNSSPVEAEASD